MLPTLGSDPELVAVAMTSDILAQYNLPATLLNQPIPAYYALDIQDVLHPQIILPHGTLTPDGMAVEFTIDPTDDVDILMQRLGANIHATQQIVEARGMKLGVEPHFYTAPEYIQRLPEEYGDACSLQILGCAPDFCIYNIPMRKRPDPRTYHYRTSGGHIHVGVGYAMLADQAAMRYIIAALDSIIGTAGTYLCKSKQALDRMLLYGSAGMTRTSYERGTLEYRTLPAQALVQTSALARMMFTAAQTVVGHMMDVYECESQPDAIKYFTQTFGTYAEIVGTVVPAINTQDADTCLRVQSSVGDRLSSYAILNTVINELQMYTMPNTFDLVWDA